MKVLKKYLTLSVTIFIYVSALALLMQQFFVYRRAYRLLGEMVSHSTIERVDFECTEGE